MESMIMILICLLIIKPKIRSQRFLFLKLQIYTPFCSVCVLFGAVWFYVQVTLVLFQDQLRSM